MNPTADAAAMMVGTPPLTPSQKQEWNGFIDYLEKSGYKGSPQLDNKNTALGASLLEQYRKVNPKFSLTYDNVRDVQQDLQDYRKSMIDQYKQGKIVVDGIKSEDEIMPGLSDVDGWLGSKTSSWRFPKAVLKESKGSVKDFGTDLAAYEAAARQYKKQ